MPMDTTSFAFHGTESFYWLDDGEDGLIYAVVHYDPRVATAWMRPVFKTPRYNKNRTHMPPTDRLMTVNRMWFAANDPASMSGVSPL